MKSFNDFVAEKEGELSEMFTNPTAIRWAKTSKNQWKGDFLIGDKKDRKSTRLNSSHT